MKKITQDHFSFKCPMDWEGMEVSANGRYCGRCKKEVFDLSNCSIDEVIALQMKHGSICGSIKVAVAAVSLGAAACQDVPRERTTGVPLRPGDEAIQRNVVTGGVICPPQELEKMKKE